MTLYIIVPVYNEAANMPMFMSALTKITHKSDQPTMIILVDDGSTDNTPQAARQTAQDLPLTVLEHNQNLGPGAAFGTAFEYLSETLQDDDWVLTMEGDNTSMPNLVSQMFQRTEEGYTVILASIYMYGGGIQNTALLRIILSKVANTFVSEVLGIAGIMTVSSFYRLHHGSVIRHLQHHYGVRIIEHHGFECMVEMLMKLIYLHTPISEVPMTLDTSKRIGKSKMRIGRTIRGYFSLFLDKARWQKLARTP